jgi:hypothetical protein
MKHDVAASLLATLVGLGLNASVTAQTCAAPGVFSPDPSGNPPVAADLCTLPDSVALYCDFLDSSGKPDGIWQITLAPGFTNTLIAVSGGVAGFNPVIFLYSSACTVGNQCASSGDANIPLALTGVTPGTYFLAASAAPSDGSGACGAVSLTTNLPVELQSFDVM